MSEHVVPTRLGLEGKVAMITGAARGIGKAIADTLAQNKVNLVLVDLSNDVTHLLSEYAKQGVKAVAIVSDLCAAGAADRITDEALKAFEQIDILVNNAGVALLDDARTLSKSDWDKTLDINLTAPFLLSQAVGRHMVDRGRGAIVNISSQAGIVALERHAAYCSTKAGLIALTKVLALEWAPMGVRVNAVAPTVVETELGRKAWEGERGREMRSRIPARRFAQPPEIAAAVAFLASDAAGMITGETLVVDGGYTIA